MDDRLWANEWFATDAFPRWHCPSCASGHLALTGVFELETGACSEYVARNGSVDPSDYSGLFQGTLACTQCLERGFVLGQVGLDWDQDNEGAGFVQKYFKPRAVIPTLHLFDIPKRCPHDVKEELTRAFMLYWVDLGASATALRTCVERILSKRRVPLMGRNKKGKKYRMSLDERLRTFKQKDPARAEQLMAVKWIGNEGTHSRVTRDDFRLQLKVMESVVGEYWGEVSVVVRRVNATRRPPSRLVRRRRRPPPRIP